MHELLRRRCLLRRARLHRLAGRAHEHAEFASRAAQPASHRSLSPARHRTLASLQASRPSTRVSLSPPACFSLRCVGTSLARIARTLVSWCSLARRPTRVRRVSWRSATTQQASGGPLCHHPPTGAARTRLRAAYHSRPHCDRPTPPPWRHWHQSRPTRPSRRCQTLLPRFQAWLTRHELTPPPSVSSPPCLRSACIALDNRLN